MLPLVFIGPMAAGKSKIGRLVARGLDVPFRDTDKLVSAVHGPIPEIFAAHGEAEFRRLERVAVRDALAEDAVVALGGGAVLDAATQAELAGHTVVLLTVSREAVGRRLSGGRPLLDSDGDADAAVERWAAIAAARTPIYESLATVTFDTSARPISHIADDIVTWARQRGLGKEREAQRD
ncbi:shikimate kinase [Microterricola viridarii]|uniref:Shikimate kinase n=1 Tax=Microterricola viridarii TaxID=412690 RepID=A0A1H1U0C5_9MICO|nr:shikimate kinase [Microterricola viridarii]